LREKVKDRGQYLDLVYFKPSHSKTPEHMQGYLKNKLSIIRQLKYSKKNEKSIDIVLFVNGLPVVTIELKNALTGQYLTHAIKQYIKIETPKNHF
jgi:type I restriction enzyme R subunit